MQLFDVQAHVAPVLCWIGNPWPTGAWRSCPLSPRLSGTLLSRTRDQNMISDYALPRARVQNPDFSLRANHTLPYHRLNVSPWCMCTERKCLKCDRLYRNTTRLGNHAANRDIFTAVVVSRILDFREEEPSIFFMSLTCYRSLCSDNLCVAAPLVWATVGEQHVATCAVADEPRALDCVASLRPILASHGERELRQRTRHTPHDHRCGACDRHPRSHWCLLYFFIDSNHFLGYCAVREPLLSKKRQRPHKNTPGASGL